MSKPWIEKLARRLLALGAGCWLIVLTVSDCGEAQWSVQQVGKVEQ